MVLGISAKVLRSGMPSDAAGPVADTVTPTLIWASAAVEKPSTAAPSSANFFNFMGLSPDRKMKPVRGGVTVPPDGTKP